MNCILFNKDTLFFLSSVQHKILEGGFLIPYFPLILADENLPEKINSLKILFPKCDDEKIFFPVDVDGKIFELQIASSGKKKCPNFENPVPLEMRQKFPKIERVFQIGQYEFFNNSWTVRDAKWVKLS